ncbi:hypothetical protein ACF0H5_015658 [Mactra antiquata]
MTENNKEKDMAALRPIMKDQFHQDSLFGNSFRSKSFFIVHPEWLSEEVENTDPEPLHRPPWPWEQPRYRQNIQYPITYTQDESNQEKIEENGEENKLQTCCDQLPAEMTSTTQMIGAPLGYSFTQPGIDITKPFEKQTMFGAPVVDTSSYKSG